MIRLRIQPSNSVQPPFQDLSFSCLLVSAILKTENDPGNYEYLKEKTERGQRVVFFANGIFRTLPTRLRHYSQASTLSRFHAFTLFFLISHSFEICYKKGIFS